MTTRTVGVSKAVKVADLVQMSEADRQVFQHRLADAATSDLREFVGGARPLGQFTFMADRAQDPLQGDIVVFTVCAPFDMDTLPLGCAARLTDQYQRSTGEQISPVTVEEIMGKGGAE